MEHWIVLFQFGPDKWIKVVAIEKGLGPLRKILLWRGQAVVLHALAGVRKDAVVSAGGLGLVVGRFDFRVIKAST